MDGIYALIHFMLGYLSRGKTVFTNHSFALLVGAVEYTDCPFAEG